MKSEVVREEEGFGEVFEGRCSGGLQRGAGVAVAEDMDKGLIVGRAWSRVPENMGSPGRKWVPF